MSFRIERLTNLEQQGIELLRLNGDENLARTLDCSSVIGADVVARSGELGQLVQAPSGQRHVGGTELARRQPAACQCLTHVSAAQNRYRSEGFAEIGSASCRERV